MTPYSSDSYVFHGIHNSIGLGVAKLRVDTVVEAPDSMNGNGSKAKFTSIVEHPVNVINLALLCLANLVSDSVKTGEVGHVFVDREEISKIHA